MSIASRNATFGCYMPIIQCICWDHGPMKSVCSLDIEVVSAKSSISALSNQNIRLCTILMIILWYREKRVKFSLSSLRATD